MYFYRKSTHIISISNLSIHENMGTSLNCLEVGILKCHLFFTGRSTSKPTTLPDIQPFVAQDQSLEGYA